VRLDAPVRSCFGTHITGDSIDLQVSAHPAPGMASPDRARLGSARPSVANEALAVARAAGIFPLHGRIASGAESARAPPPPPVLTGHVSSLLPY
jgi:hypothetical protein